MPFLFAVNEHLLQLLNHLLLHSQVLHYDGLLLVKQRPFLLQLFLHHLLQFLFLLRYNCVLHVHLLRHLLHVVRTYFILERCELFLYLLQFFTFHLEIFALLLYYQPQLRYFSHHFPILGLQLIVLGCFISIFLLQHIYLNVQLFHFSPFSPQCRQQQLDLLVLRFLYEVRVQVTAFVL